jgi:hypothetical protein
LGFTRKKISKIFIERNYEERCEWARRCFEPEWLENPRLRVYFDETNVDDRKFMRMYGYALRGKRCFAKAINFHGQRFSMRI